MNKYFLVTTNYIKEFTDGTLKRVSDPFLLSGLSFTDAEAKIYKEVGEFVRGEFLVQSIKKVNYADVFQYDDAETWYEVKATSKIEDADTGREKNIRHKYLVSAHSCREAIDRIEESLKGLMVAYHIDSVLRTKIIEVFIGDGFQHKMDLKEEE